MAVSLWHSEISDVHSLDLDMRPKRLIILPINMLFRTASGRMKFDNFYSLDALD